MNRPPQPLYRKYNKLPRWSNGCRSGGGDFRHERNGKTMKNFAGTHRSMRRTRDGYDYTPLFQFLLSQVGRNWDEVFSEAVGRLDKQAPIFWLVDLHFREGNPGTVRTGDNAYFSKLTVTEGVLVKADPLAEAPCRSCTCCTHSFNGVPY